MTMEHDLRQAALLALNAALQRARELGANEMDWLGTGSSQRYANEEEREYLKIIDAGIAALSAIEAAQGDSVHLAAASPPLPQEQGAVPLTDEQIMDLAMPYYPDSINFARRIEAAHGIPAPPVADPGQADTQGEKL